MATPDHRTLEERLQAAVGKRFQILGRLGEGGMGTVFLARESSRLGRQVAIKVLSLHLAMNAEFQERFLREAQTIARLRHEFIININDFVQSDGLSFFIMPYIPGRSLDSVIKLQSALPQDVVRTWIFQIASALAYAHARSVIHRDVKPSNILLDADGNVVLTDFGIAQEEFSDNPELTSTGLVVGSPRYLSPERWNGERASPATDQYSLGVMAFEMITGDPPFHGTSTLSWADAHARQPPPAIEALRPDCPSDISAMVTRMLAKTAGERFSSMSDVCAATGAGHQPRSASQRRTLAQAGTSAPQDTQLRVLGMSGPLRMGEERRIHAEVVDPTGHAISGASFGWSSSDPTIAVVTPEGIVRGLRPGEVEVTALFAGRFEVVPIKVEPPAVTEVRLQPSTQVLVVGDSSRMEARPMDVRRELVESTGLAWSSDNPGIAEVSDDGIVTAVSVGTAAIRATCGGIAGRAVVRVVRDLVASVDVHPSEATLHEFEPLSLQATVRRYDGTEVGGASIEWSSDDPSVATVDPTGQVSTVAGGVVVLRAKIGGHEGVALLTVLPAAIQNVLLQASSIALAPEEEFILRARVIGTGDRVLDRPVVWSSDDPHVVDVDSGGVLRARRSGQVLVRARCEDQEATATVVVAESPVGTPSGGMLRSGSGAPSASGLVSSGLTPPPIGASPSDPVPGLPRVDEGGGGPRKTRTFVLAAVAVPALVLAVWFGVRSSGGANPEAGAGLSSLDIQLPRLVQVGDAFPLVAVGRDAEGELIEGTVVRWETDTPETVAIDSVANSLTAVAAGRAVLRVLSGSIRSASNFEVRPPPVGAIAVRVQTVGGGGDANGYTLTLDGELLPQRLAVSGSLTIDSLSLGRHHLELGDVARTCTASEGVTVDVNESAPANAAFRVECATVAVVGPPPEAPPGRGKIAIRLDPSWATLSLNGREVRQGTAFEEEVDAGRVQIRLQRDGWVTVDTIAVVGAGETVQMRIRMVPGG